MVSPLLLLLAALALSWLYTYAGRRWTAASWQPLLAGASLLALVVLDLRPWGVMQFHAREGSYGVLSGPLHRPAREANATTYRQLARAVSAGTVVFNVPYGDEQAALFFSGCSVYPGIPAEADVRRLRARGVRVATYSAQPGQSLPPYLQGPGIQQLPGQLLVY